MKFTMLMSRPVSIVILFLLTGFSILQAAPVGVFLPSGQEKVQILVSDSSPLLLAENDNQDNQPAPGTLVLPDEGKTSNNGNGEKKCMTVCASWGEECQYINRGAGGLTKKCRRACKQFTEECF